MHIEFRAPQSDIELNNYFYFRWKLLRKPLNLPLSSEQDTLEDSSHHLAGYYKEQIISVGRLQIEKDSSARIRYMAVDQHFRKKGIGCRLLKNLEEIAIKNNAKECWLYARDSAVPFYVKNNYQINGLAKTDLKIKHHRMEKALHY